MGSLAINGQALRKGGQCHLLALCGGAAVNPGSWVASRKLEAEQLPGEAAYGQLHLYGPSSREGRGRRQVQVGRSFSVY